MLNRIYLNDHWCYSHEDQPEKTEIVRLPHNNQDLPFHYFDETLYQFISVYERDISIPAEWKGQNVSILFEGVAHQCDVYCNDVLVGSHACGYTQFRVPITEQVQYGETAHLKVVVDSRETLDIPPFGHVIDYLTYGGIYREVILEATGPVSLEKTFVHGLDVYSTDKTFQVDFTVTSTVALQNRPLNVDLFVFDGTTCILSLEDQRAVIGPNSFQLHSDQLKIWDLSTPNLYTLKIRLSLDGIPSDTDEVTFGLRDAVFKRDGFYLNGKCMKLRGLDRHQSFPYVGYAMPQSMQEEDARTLKYRLGLNAVRTSHYPQSKYFLDECDRLGLLVFTEAPGWQHIGDAAWKDIAVHNVQEMVEEYRNHPSIMLWGVRINESVDDDAFYERTNALARKLDPTRPTGGVRCNEKMHLLEDVYTYNDFSHNGSTPGCKPKAKVTPDTKKAYFISEYNGHMYPTKMFDWEEHRMEHTLRHARVLNEVALQKDIAGSFGWCMFDYNTHKDFGSGDRICYHGVMDMFRNPKMAAAIYAAQSDEEAVLEVTSSMDIGEHPASVRGETYMITNADSVRMYKNDQFIKEYKPDKELFPGLSHPPMVVDDYIGDAMKEGEGYSDHVNTLVKTCLNETAIHGYRISAKVASAAARLVLFHRFKWQDAVNLFQKYVGDWGGSAKVYKFEAVKNGEVVKTVVKAAETKVCLKAKVSHHNLQEKTSYDVAAVRIVAEDEWGNQLPFYGEALRVTVDGPLDIIGPKTTVFRGGATGFYLRTKGVEGKATVTCEAENAEPVTLQFEVES